MLGKYIIINNYTITIYLNWSIDDLISFILLILLEINTLFEIQIWIPEFIINTLEIGPGPAKGLRIFYISIYTQMVGQDRFMFNLSPWLVDCDKLAN